MTKIAIIGKEGAATIEDALKELLKIAGLTVFSSSKYSTFKQLAYKGADVFIAPISTYLLEQNKLNIDIVIFASAEGNSDSSFKAGKGALNLINENAIIIINADDKEIYKYLIGSKANLLTYGFNGKASVTASSILENLDSKFIQICVQRSFKAINGLTVEAQEIPVTLSLKKDAQVLNEIAAVTAALALGISTKIIAIFASR